MRNDLAEILFQSVLQEALVSSSGVGRDVVHLAFPLLTAASLTLQGALGNGYGQAVVVCDMPEQCKFPTLVSCQKRFL